MAAHLNRVQARISSITESMFMSSGSPTSKKKLPVIDDAASTDAGEDSPHTDASTSPRNMSSGEDFSDSDTLRTRTSGDFSEERKPAVSDGTQGDCVYSIIFLIQMRAALTASKSVARTCGPTATAKEPTHKVPETKRQTDSESPKASSMSWAAQRRSAAQGVRNDDEKVARAARSLLNKLTIEKFESIFEQLTNCGIKTPDHVSILVHEVFEKATAQHHFTPMYADLCVRLEGYARISSIVGPDGTQQSFRRLLLNQCQIRFEQMCEPDASEDVCEEEVEARRKKQALGNVKLVGELIVRGLLSSKLLVEISEELLRNWKAFPQAWALESLANLLTVAGSTFDNENYRYHARFIDLISAVTELSRDKSTPARMRCLLKDVLDIRDAGWSTSKNQAAVRAAPKRLEEVREEVEGEQRKAVNDKPVRAPHARSQRGEWKPTLNKSSAGYARNEWKPTLNKSMHHEQIHSKGAPPSLESSTVNMAAGASAPTPKNGSTPWQQNRNRGECGPTTKVSKNCQDAVQRESKTSAAPPGFEPLPATPPVATAPAPFSAAAFRKELTATFRELGMNRSVVAAVGRIRAQQVPVSCQAKEFADIVTRTVEETRSPIRRLAFAFLTGLASGEHSTFEKKECLAGLRLFFDEVYVDLCDEIPRLPSIVTRELLPTLGNVFAASDLDKFLENIIPTGSQA